MSVDVPATPRPAAPAAHTLPPRACEVLVVGAGPAGSACALALARAGVDVVLVDQHDFPRDKVCGDGLIPDAHAALRRLGVLDEVLQQALPAAAVRCFGPSGRHVDVDGQLSVLPRRVLDDIVKRAAERAGARFFAPWRFEVALDAGPDPTPDTASAPGAPGRVHGARLRGRDGAAHDIAARWVVLATGAVPQAMQAAGLCQRHTPTGVALRGYWRHPGLAAEVRQLQIVWHPRLRGGYGWMFPGPDGVFNLGTGLTSSHQRTRRGHGRLHDINLRQMLAAFAEVHPPAARLLAEGQALGPLKGAPLRCSLRGAHWSRPGLLATGEAIGSTYAFSGEGIGKALETGLLAAEALLPGRRLADIAPATDTAVGEHYAAALHALQPRFDIYETASHVNHRPWLADLVVWRARKSPRVMHKLRGVLDETHAPRLFSWGGVARLIFQ